MWGTNTQGLVYLKVGNLIQFIRALQQICRESVYFKLHYCSTHDSFEYYLCVPPCSHFFSVRVVIGTDNQSSLRNVF